MVQKAYKLHNLVIGATTIKGVESLNINNIVTQYAMQGGGSLDPFNIASLKVDQTITFTTTDIATFLGACGISGTAITSGATAIFYLRQLADGGTFTGGTADASFTITKGKVYIQNISANHNGVAVLTAVVRPTYDGSNLPIIISLTATAPTLTRDVDLYTLGPLKIVSTLVPIMSMNFDLNLGVEAVGADGVTYNTEVFTVSRNPQFTYALHNVGLPASLSPYIGAATGGDVVSYLRKLTVGGGMVADATASHIQFKMKDGQVSTDGGGAQGLQLGTASLKITPAYDTSNAIVAIDTAIAIT